MEEGLTGRNISEKIPEELIKPDKEGLISIQEGMDFCGSTYSFVKFLKTFLRSIDDKAKEIEDALTSEDYQLYTMKVHSLKSTSRIIGAHRLSELSKKLELAGESGEIDVIKEKTGELLELYRSYSNKLSDISSISLDGIKLRPLASREIIDDAYRALREVSPMMDYDSVEMIIEGLKKYKLPEDEKERIEKIEYYLKKLDWESVQDLLNDKKEV
ncbi:Hpt domain-containing protein [Butyrivibrio sp. XBB1001]|uniref:Hpt domain-containing protein n=1 Tax=Butyrivibrio sp. XBB1001 TaxID=1280682 RepID=UPI0003F87CB3|nr:Hpt domain-containing protein [Butyrivibrio sp. XBB1001]